MRRTCESRHRLGRRPALWSLLLLAPVALLPACSKTTAPGSDYEIVSPVPYLMCGESAEFHVRSDAPLVADEGGPDLTWSADHGTIVGAGPSVTFVAPDSAITATLSAEIVDGEGARHRMVLRLPVYRQVVILKADDFVYESGADTGVPVGWQLYFAYILDKGLKTTAGVIGSRLADAPRSFFTRLRALSEIGQIEFFDHGWSHALDFPLKDGTIGDEFKGTSYEEQRASLEATQGLLRDRAGVVLHGFGAPGNAWDQSTRRLVDEDPEIDYWFFGAPPTTKVLFVRRADIDKNGIPDRPTFVGTYRPDVPCLVYEVHPWFWKWDDLVVFASCVQDLLARGDAFVLPQEYCAHAAGARQAAVK